MATNVIHGEGKPAIYIKTARLITDTVKSISSVTVELDTAINLAALNTAVGLIYRMVFSKNSSAEHTSGILQSFTEVGGEFLVVDAWSNGAPVVGQEIFVEDFNLVLPYAQALIESFNPDFITKKYLNGNISVRERGWYYSAILDYSRYANKSLVAKLYPLFKINIGDITFVPRSDNLAISYKVKLSPETSTQIRQLRKHQGHGLFQINLIGVQRLTEVPVYDGSVVGGYGEDYGENYGATL